MDRLRALVRRPRRTEAASTYLEDVTAQLSRLVGSERCALLVLDGGRLYHGAAVGMPSSFCAAIDGFKIGPESGSCGAAAALRRRVITRDIAIDPSWRDFRLLAEQANLRSCWSVPMVLPDGEVVGTFATYTPEPYEPPTELVELAAAHASLVALGIAGIGRRPSTAPAHDPVVRALSSALDERDEYTGAHSIATAGIALAVGARLGLDAGEMEDLERTAVLHDVGKLGVPTELLQARRPLTEREREVIERHPLIGEQILENVSELEAVAKAVRHEHERWDGDGYPDGLAGEEIPLASRIVLVCDAWHAMTTDRPYRQAMPFERARTEVRDGVGSQFDPRAATALLSLLEEHGDDLPSIGPNRRFRPSQAGSSTSG